MNCCAFSADIPPSLSGSQVVQLKTVSCKVLPCAVASLGCLETVGRLQHQVQIQGHEMQGVLDIIWDVIKEDFCIEGFL